MTKVNRQELLSRIAQKIEHLKAERTSLQERLRLVDGMLEEYEALTAPQEVPRIDVPAAVGSRSAARQRRKMAMAAFLLEVGEASTADIIAAVKKALPTEQVTRAAVADVLRFDPAFTKADPDKKGAWRLRPNTEVAIVGTEFRQVVTAATLASGRRPVVFHGGGAVIPDSGTKEESEDRW